MATYATFKEEFYSLCELIGEDMPTLTNRIGKYDDIDQDQHRSYIWFKDSNAQFYIPHEGDSPNRAWKFSIPKVDAYGHYYDGLKDYYSFDGIRLGMTKSEVLAAWGEPDDPIEKDDYGWNYRQRNTQTSKGIEISFMIFFRVYKDDPSGNEDYYVSHFIASATRPPSASATRPPSNSCFIATACYGNYEAAEVLVLRQYRDEVMLKSAIGKALVSAYYFLSPPLAKFIEQSDSLKTFIREYFLVPIISLIQRKKERH